MEPMSLNNLYNNLKNEISGPISSNQMFHVGNDSEAHRWHHKAMLNANDLKDKCRKHILMDIYCKILPLDDDYVKGHMGQMDDDINKMLDMKGMTPTQYFTSCSESTKAPFVEFIINSTKEIANAYMEKQDEVLKDAKENDIELPEPEVPDIEEPEVKSQLVDIESDMEYDNFVDALKKKTIDKIVDDVSNIIAGEKEEKDMTFNPVQESTVGVVMDYIQKKTWNEDVDQEQMIGLAIREATLHEFDCVFNLNGKNFNEYATRIRLGKGYLFNESSKR